MSYISEDTFGYYIYVIIGRDAFYRVNVPVIKIGYTKNIDEKFNEYERRLQYIHFDPKYSCYMKMNVDKTKYDAQNIIDFMKQVCLRNNMKIHNIHNHDTHSKYSNKFFSCIDYDYKICHNVYINVLRELLYVINSNETTIQDIIQKYNSIFVNSYSNYIHGYANILNEIYTCENYLHYGINENTFNDYPFEPNEEYMPMYFDDSSQYYGTTYVDYDDTSNQYYDYDTTYGDYEHETSSNTDLFNFILFDDN